MSKRVLALTGFACPASAWERFLGPEVRVVPLSEVVASCSSGHPLEWAKAARKHVADLQPRLLIAHDVGVLLALLSVLKLRKQPDYKVPRLLLFNGAFRGFDVFQATHPWRFQFATEARVRAEAERAGGEFDPWWNGRLGRMRTFYRYAILANLKEKLLRSGEKRFSALPITLIRSANDPYIPASSLDQLERDFQVAHSERFDYGHFPYTAVGLQRRVRALIGELG
ncbi:hypothetical protein K2X33_07225 [bacterium]|nr:hypothetical protein [bacterium]